MPILFVNGKRRGMRVRGRARVSLTGNPKRARKRRMPAGLARYWAKRGRRKSYSRTAVERRALRRESKRGPAWKARVRKDIAALERQAANDWGFRPRARKRRNPTVTMHDGRRVKMSAAQWDSMQRAGRAKQRRRKTSHKRRRRARRSTPVMAKRRKRRARKSTVPRRRRRRKVASAPRRRRRRKRARKATTRRRKPRRGRYVGSPRRRRRRSARVKAHRTAPRRRRRKRARKATTTRRRRRRRAHTATVRAPRRRRRRSSATVLMHGGQSRTLRMNPSRRRRRRRGRARSYGRRYRRRSYRRNPGGFLIDLAKRALPVLFGFYGTRLLVSKIGPMIPGVSALGTLQGPVLAVVGVVGMNFATKKIAPLARHRNELMLGSMFQALDSLIQAFAPPSVKALVGMSDYVAVGDYFAVGATPLNDQMTMSDYIAVGSDGVEQELGLEEELGVEEELGSDGLMGGVTQGSLVAQVPTQRFLAPIPARSFTRNIPAAGPGYDNPNQLYGGIFNGGFGR